MSHFFFTFINKPLLNAYYVRCLWEKASDISTQWSDSWYSCPCVIIASPLVQAWPGDSLLTNRICQKCWVSLPGQKTATSADTLSLAIISFLSHLLALMKIATLLWAALWRGLGGKELKEIIVYVELDLVDNCERKPGSRSTPSWAFRWE